MRCMMFLALSMVAAGGAGSVEFAARNSSQPRQEQMAALPVKSVRVNGTELSYIEQGRGEPVILIHGFLSDYRVWTAQVSGLSKHYRVIAYSRRYHHPNPWPPAPPQTSFSQDAEDLAALIGALKLRRVHLVGHSAGAHVAALVARDYPQLVRSVVFGEPLFEALVAQSPEAASLPPLMFFADANKAFQQGDDEGGLRILVEGIIGRGGAYEEMPAHLHRMLLDNLRLGKAQMAARAPAPFTCDDARRIKTPALVLEGEQTVKVFHVAAEELRKCLPHGEQAVLAGATHALELDNPAGFNEIVLKFFAKQAVSSGGR